MVNSSKNKRKWIKMEDDFDALKQIFKTIDGNGRCIIRSF